MWSAYRAVLPATAQFCGQGTVMRAILVLCRGILPAQRLRSIMPERWSVIPRVQMEREPFSGQTATEWKNWEFCLAVAQVVRLPLTIPALYSEPRQRSREIMRLSGTGKQGCWT